jgi:membrane-bound lytic murein transglycosylase A
MIASCVRTGLLVCALAVSGAGAGLAQTVTLLEFGDLDGWADDDHAAALSVFRNTCGDMVDPDWRTLCAIAGEAADARAFFELFFRPVLVEDGQPMLFTGYFEPQLRGSLTPDETYRFPLYALPTGFPAGTPMPTRAEIEDGALAGMGLEIAWVDDAVDLFFLQIQGSGRISLPDGRVIRVGYAGANGRPYTSIGQELVRQGIYTADQVSAEVIRNWAARNPEAGRDLLRLNESYVFFREVSEVPADLGPLGAMNRSVTTLRTVAVDPAYTPLGAPVWIEKDGAEPMRRLMIAQDTGSAIKGAQRADIFFGTGLAAGIRAGRIKDGGRMVILLPIQRAYAMLPVRLAEDR